MILSEKKNYTFSSKFKCFLSKIFWGKKQFVFKVFSVLRLKVEGKVDFNQ